MCSIHAGGRGDDREINFKIVAIIHKKIWQEYFEKIISGKKKFDLRLADFKINKGDILVLEEWDVVKEEYTGRKVEVIATYIFKTKNQIFWSKDKVDKFGFQVIQLEPKTEFPRGVEVVGSVIIEKAGKILLAKSSKWSNKWILPGGHLEVGESILAALQREGEEETGLKLKPIKILTFGELIGSRDFHRRAHFIYFDGIFEAIGGKLKLQKSELNTAQWFIPQEALKLDLAESYFETLKKYIDFLG